MAKRTYDLMAALKDPKAAQFARQRRQMADIEVEIRGKLEVVVDDQEIALTLAGELADQIKRDLEASPIPVSEETAARRGRAPGSPGRYPPGYTSNPSGPYGRDSGYLADSIKAAVESGNTALAGLPKNRQKAAFVIRRVSPTARGEFERKAVDDGLTAILKQMLKGGR